MRGGYWSGIQHSPNSVMKNTRMSPVHRDGAMYPVGILGLSYLERQ